MSTKDFNYSEPAELYGGGNWNKRPAAITYRRFDTAAEAIRFAVEELNDAGRRACVLEVDDRRFNSVAIQKLYESGDYPFPRPDGKDTNAT